jgi:predicted Zn-dependent peptidase
MLPLLALVSALAFTDSVPAPDRSEATASRSAASFVLHHQPAIALVSLRMSLLADDPSGYAGAGHLIQHLVFPSIQNQVGRVGGTAQMQRTSDAVVYTVTGPALELEYLAGVLRGALVVPEVTSATVLAANRALAEERLAEWETADQHIRAALRARLFPNDVSPAGTESSARRMTAQTVGDLWAQMYHPERISVVAVGDIGMADLEHAFSDLPPARTARRAAEARDTVSRRPLAPAQATRAWLGNAYLTNDLNPAVASVLARLLRDDLRRRLPRAQVEAEHWWTHHGQAVVLVISTPEADLANARRMLSGALASVQRETDARRVTEAARAIRREILFYSRTTDRMAEVLGGFTDRGGDPDAAQQFFTALDRVTLQQARTALDQLIQRSPAREEIAPQALQRRP